MGRDAEAHLVGVVVRSRNLDRGGEVEDDGGLIALVLAREPGLLHGVAQLDGKLGLGLGERLRRVLELPVGAVAARNRLVDELAVTTVGRVVGGVGPRITDAPDVDVRLTPRHLCIDGSTILGLWRVGDG